jgi:aryl-alcohol dehydrogenase-like predicted oxidoreductase
MAADWWVTEQTARRCRARVWGGPSMSALAAGWVLAQGAQPIIGTRTAAAARQIAAFRPIPADLAAAAHAAVDAAFAATR